MRLVRGQIQLAQTREDGRGGGLGFGGCGRARTDKTSKGPHRGEGGGMGEEDEVTRQRSRSATFLISSVFATAPEVASEAKCRHYSYPKVTIRQKKSTLYFISKSKRHTLQNQQTVSSAL